MGTDLIEPAHTNTGQLPVPLPAEQDKTDSTCTLIPHLVDAYKTDTKPTQDASEDVVGQSADIIEDGSGNNTEDGALTDSDRLSAT